MNNEILPGEVLILRTCYADMTSYKGFRWPTSGEVSCPDWDPEILFGHGLHGLLWGEGDAHLLLVNEDARWLVAAVPADSIVILGGNVKFPRARVLYCGTREDAINYLMANGGAGKAVVFSTVTAGNHGNATVGDYGIATAGHYGTATAKRYGTATVGDYGTATAGNYGIATAGYHGTAKAGKNGVVAIRDWDSEADRWRLLVGYVGEDGILPNTPYRVKAGNLVAVDTESDTGLKGGRRDE